MMRDRPEITATTQRVSLAARIVGLFDRVLHEERDHAAFEALAPFPGESFLVIGPGSGYCVRHILSVTGVGPVHVVRTQSWRNGLIADQNSASLKQGNLKIIPAEALDGEQYHHFFDAILSINAVKNWSIISEELLELRRLLRPAGRLLMVWTVRAKSDRDLLPALLTALPEAGYLTIRQKQIATRPLSCCIVEVRRNG